MTFGLMHASLVSPRFTVTGWDATECVEFGLLMAREALVHDLQLESEFIQRFDVAFRAVNDSIDMNNNDLVFLVRSCLQNGMVLSKGRRKQLLARGHAAELLEKAERVINEALAEGEDRGPNSNG